MTTALVTGAGGFAGSHLCEYLLEQGDQVVALVGPSNQRANLSHLGHRLCIESGDIRDSACLLSVLSRHRPSRIYHLASLSSKFPSADQPWLPFDVILKGSLNLFQAWRDSGIESRLLYVSSAEVYGGGVDSRMPLTEEHPFLPENPYASSKAAAELLAYQFFMSYGLYTVRVRAFPHTGPRQKPEFVCSSLARQFAQISLGLRPATVAVGNRGVQRDFSDVRDVVRGYHLLLEQGEPGDVYQICSGKPVSINDILDILIGMTHQQVQVVAESSRMRAKESSALWGDPARADAAVGWKPRLPIEQTLRDLKAYWEQTLK